MFDELPNYYKSLLEAQNEAVPDGLLIVGTQGKILSYNLHFNSIWDIPQAILEAKDEKAVLEYAKSKVMDPEAFIEPINALYASTSTDSYMDILHLRDGRLIERYGKSVSGSQGLQHGWVWHFRDITEQTRNQEELVRQKTLYQNVVEGISDAFISFDFDWNIIYTNSKAAAWGQFVKEDILGQNVWKMFPQIVGTPIGDLYTQCMQSRQQLSIEYYLPDTDMWLNIKAYPSLDGISVFATDITDNKKYEKGLRDSEDLFRTMANSIFHLAWMADKEGWIQWYNDRWYAYTGTTLNEMQGWGWEKVHHPDHIERVIEFVREAWTKDEPWELTFPLRRHDGAYRWFLTRAYPVKDLAGGILHWIGTNTDINDQLEIAKALKQSEEQLKQLSDFMPQIVWAADASGYHDFYNKRWYEFTGLSPQETKDTGWTKVLHPQDLDRTWQTWNRSLQTGALYEIEYRMRRVDGEYRWLLARAMPLRDDSGNITRWFGTCTDIHDQKRAADILELKVAERTKDLQEANTYLKSMNDELRQFNYIASHDLQEPLRKIMIFADRIKMKDAANLSEASLDFLNRMAISSQRMSALLKDLLDFSSINREDFFSKVNLNIIIKEIETDLEVVITQKTAQIHKENLPTLQAISLQMHQLFYNLITNALKFVPPERTPEIHIKSTTIAAHEAQDWGLPGHKEYVHLSVEDNGIGFEQEFADKIFVLFKRLHSQHTFSGTGVGLALCKKVVENHYGRIWAESDLGQGTTFHVILPTY
jgi:PAS domain S-box-containing protein